jgi:hypothetical protein
MGVWKRTYSAGVLRKNYSQLLGHDQEGSTRVGALHNSFHLKTEAEASYKTCFNCILYDWQSLKEVCCWMPYIIAKTLCYWQTCFLACALIYVFRTGIMQDTSILIYADDVSLLYKNRIYHKYKLRSPLWKVFIHAVKFFITKNKLETHSLITKNKGYFQYLL